jgi:hypothetical protein
LTKEVAMNFSVEQKADIASEAAKAAPPVTVAGATVAGLPVNDLILWATLIYLVLQIGFLLYRWQRLYFSRKVDEESGT